MQFDFWPFAFAMPPRSEHPGEHLQELPHGELLRRIEEARSTAERHVYVAEVERRLQGVAQPSAHEHPWDASNGGC